MPLNKKDELLHFAWGLIANANDGNWSELSQEWHDAAETWRDEYHEMIASGLIEREMEEEVPPNA